jgi:hypothetical protein
LILDNNHEHNPFNAVLICSLALQVCKLVLFDTPGPADFFGARLPNPSPYTCICSPFFFPAEIRLPNPTSTIIIRFHRRHHPLPPAIARNLRGPSTTSRSTGPLICENCSPTFRYPVNQGGSLAVSHQSPHSQGADLRWCHAAAAVRTTTWLWIFGFWHFLSTTLYEADKFIHSISFLHTDQQFICCTDSLMPVFATHFFRSGPQPRVC